MFCKGSPRNNQISTDSTKCYCFTVAVSNATLWVWFVLPQVSRRLFRSGHLSLPSPACTFPYLRHHHIDSAMPSSRGNRWDACDWVHGLWTSSCCCMNIPGPTWRQPKRRVWSLWHWSVSLICCLIRIHSGSSVSKWYPSGSAEHNTRQQQQISSCFLCIKNTWFVVWFVSIRDLVYLSGIQVVVQNTTHGNNNRFPCLSIHHPPGRPNAQ